MCNNATSAKYLMVQNIEDSSSTKVD